MPMKLTKRVIEALEPKAQPYDVRDSLCRGFLVRIEKKSKTFWFAFSAHKFGGRRGQRIYLGEFPGRKVEGMRAEADAAKADVGKGIDPRLSRKEKRAQAEKEKLATLKTFLDDKFEPWAVAHMRSAKDQLTRIRSDFADHLTKPMTGFHEVMIEGLRQKWKKEGLNPKTINRDVQRIGSVLSRAVEWGVLDRHPLKGLKPMKYNKTPRVRYLSPTEEAALREALIKREDRMRAERVRMNEHLAARGKELLPSYEGDYLDRLRPLVLVALNCGLRRGELFSLHWENVRLDEKWLTVIAATAKSGQTRRIPLNNEALAVLTTWRDRQTDTSGLVFSGADGARLTNITKSWNRVVKSAGVTGFHFHDLRHSFASKLVQAGVNLNTVRELLGHKDLETTQMYAHLDPQNLIAAVAHVG